MSTSALSKILSKKMSRFQIENIKSSGINRVQHGHMDRETENDLVNKKFFFSSGEILLIDCLKLHEIGDQILK